MNAPLNRTACCLALAALAIASALSAQQAPPQAAGEPATAVAPDANATDQPSTQPAQPLLEANPAIRAALDVPRKQPRDFVQAILWLVDLGRPELAKPILDELAKLQLSNEQRIALVNEFGSQAMLRIARTKQLAPEGVAFSDACMTAASAAAVNPPRLAELVKQLTDPSPENRITARNDLAATGQVGAKAALEALARETDPVRRSLLVDAIERMHPLVERPLLAMLDTNDPQLYADVAHLLERLAVPQAVPLLSANSVNVDKSLANAIRNYRHGTPPFPIDESNHVELWSWNDGTKSLSSARVPADDAQIMWIARLADQLARTRPDHVDQQQALVLRLEADGLARGKPQPAQPINRALLAHAGPRVLSSALSMALDAGYSHAALALVEALGKAGDNTILMSTDGTPAPLVAALDSPDRRVRFAALAAIVTMNPAEPYPGSSRVPDALAWFASSNGEGEAVVAMPTLAAATNLAGQLAAHKLSGQATNRAREAVDMARAKPDVEAIFIDMNILLPDIRQAIYELRTSPETGDVPIALLAPENKLGHAKRIAAEHTRVVAVPRPHSAEAVAAIVHDLNQLASRSFVPTDQRVREAAQARKWLADLSNGTRPFYTFRRNALRVASTTVPVAPPNAAPSPSAPPASESLPSP